MPARFTLPNEAYEWPLASGVEARFWAKVARQRRDRCWLWTAFLNPAGYGMLRNGRVMALAHRLSWAIHHGKVPAGLHVLHRCDTPACVNPAHLYLGTNADNIRDKIMRGRSSYPRPERQGEKHPMAKLTDAQVQEIRRIATGRHGEGREFARQFGVSPATICCILKGKSWQSV